MCLGEKIPTEVDIYSPPRSIENGPLLQCGEVRRMD